MPIFAYMVALGIDHLPFITLFLEAWWWKYVDDVWTLKHLGGGKLTSRSDVFALKPASPSSLNFSSCVMGYEKRPEMKLRGKLWNQVNAFVPLETREDVFVRLSRGNFLFCVFEFDLVCPTSRKSDARCVLLLVNNQPVCARFPLHNNFFAVCKFWTLSPHQMRLMLPLCMDGNPSKVL